MKLTTAFAILTIAAAPAAASSFDTFVPTGETTGPLSGQATYDFGQLFVDDDLFELSIVATLAADGSFDASDGTVNDLSFFTFGGLLEGRLVDIVFGETGIHALFKTTDDTFAGSPWGNRVRATIDIPSVDWSGGAALTDLAGFGAAAGTPVTATLDAVAPIPLPATLPMLACAALALGVVARRVLR